MNVRYDSQSGFYIFPGGAPTTTEGFRNLLHTDRRAALFLLFSYWVEEWAEDGPKEIERVLRLWQRRRAGEFPRINPDLDTDPSALAEDDPQETARVLALWTERGDLNLGITADAELIALFEERFG